MNPTHVYNFLNKKTRWRMQSECPSFTFGTDGARGLCVLASALGLMVHVVLCVLDSPLGPMEHAVPCLLGLTKGW